MSLAGSGFLSIYELGAVDCLQQHWPRLFKKANFAGASAGAVLAACLVCGVPSQTIKSSFLDAALESQRWTMGPFSPNFNVEDYLKLGLEALPPDAHQQTSGRLVVSLTRTSGGKNVLVSEWKSREELIQCLLCSCFIPLFSGFKFPNFRGEKYIDGGFTNNLPLIQNQTSITISPFDSLVDISPKSGSKKRPLYVKLSNEMTALSLANLSKFMRALFPPPVEVLEDLYILGYRDAHHFLQQKIRLLREGKLLPRQS